MLLLDGNEGGTPVMQNILSYYDILSNKKVIPIYSGLILSFTGSVLVSGREQLLLLPEPKVSIAEYHLSID